MSAGRTPAGFACRNSSGPPRPLTVAVVMPTLNEAGNIGPMIEIMAGKIFGSIPGAVMHLVVADDASTDGTAAVVRAKMTMYPGLHLVPGKPAGLGWAVVRGMRYAMDALGADAVMEMDADFQHDPQDVKTLVAAMRQGADLVLGSRFTRGGSIPPDWAWYRRWTSRWGNHVARRVLKLPAIQDLTTGFRLTRVQGVLDRIALERLIGLHYFAYKFDLLVQALGHAATVREIPVHFRKRTGEKTKFRTKEIFVSLGVITALRLRANRLVEPGRRVEKAGK